MERENFSEGNFKVIKQFIVLERCLHFFSHPDGFPRYSDIVPVTPSTAKSLCVKNGHFVFIILSKAKSFCVNSNATKAPHLYYGSYYAENLFQNFFKNSSRIVKLFVEFFVYCMRRKNLMKNLSEKSEKL